jgi:hypothetical protein
MINWQLLTEDNKPLAPGWYLAHIPEWNLSPVRVLWYEDDEWTLGDVSVTPLNAPVESWAPINMPDEPFILDNWSGEYKLCLLEELADHKAEHKFYLDKYNSLFYAIKEHDLEWLTEWMMEGAKKALEELSENP